MIRKLVIVLICTIFVFSCLPLTTSSSIKQTTRASEITASKIYYPEYNPDEFPDHFSWRDVNGTNYITPIRQQAPYPSCESFGFTAAVESLVLKKLGFYFDCDLSEAHLYFHCDGNLDWGSFPREDLDYLVEYGIPDEACWPYPKVRKQYPKNTTCPNWQERTVKITDWFFLPSDNVSAIKAVLLDHGPVPTYFHVYKDFQLYKEGVYMHRWGELLGAHYVCIVGYQDDPSIPSGGYWIVKNSWGSNWGDNGWFKIAYGECSIELMPVFIDDVYGNFPVLFVDDDNTGGPWDGSENHPYKDVQTAIDNAYERYTIYVKNGTYYGNILVNKTVNLIGEDKYNTVLDGNEDGTVLVINDSDIRVSGFTVQNSGTMLFDEGIKTFNLDSNATIEGNIIKGCDVGIYLYFTRALSSNLIKGNILEDNRLGLFCLQSNNNILQGNVIRDSHSHAVEIEASQSGVFIDNVIENNSGYGIFLRGASSMFTIQHNDIIGNDIGVFLDHTHQGVVKNNNFVDNEQQASFTDSYLNKWQHNYWNDWPHLFPRVIKGSATSYQIPWFNVDWLPSKNLI